MRGIAFERKEHSSYSRELPQRVLHLSKEIRAAATRREVTYACCSCQISHIHIGTSVLDVYADEKRFRVFREIRIKSLRLLLTCWTSKQLLEGGPGDRVGFRDRSNSGMDRRRTIRLVDLRIWKIKFYLHRLLLSVDVAKCAEQQ